MPKQNKAPRIKFTAYWLVLKALLQKQLAGGITGEKTGAQAFREWMQGSVNKTLAEQGKAVIKTVEVDGKPSTVPMFLITLEKARNKVTALMDEYFAIHRRIPNPVAGTKVDSFGNVEIFPVMVEKTVDGETVHEPTGELYYVATVDGKTTRHALPEGTTEAILPELSGFPATERRKVDKRAAMRETAEAESSAIDAQLDAILNS